MNDLELKVSMPARTLPYTKRGVHVKGEYLNQYDGYSVSASLLWYLPGLREEEFISFQNIQWSLLPNSTTLLIDLTDPNSKY